MQYRRFGRTNEQVSAMGFGTWPMSGDRYGAIEIDEAVKAIQAAIDAGVNCVDTAPAYGSGQQVSQTGPRRLRWHRIAGEQSDDHDQEEAGRGKECEDHQVGATLLGQVNKTALPRVVAVPFIEIAEPEGQEQHQR